MKPAPPVTRIIRGPLYSFPSGYYAARKLEYAKKLRHLRRMKAKSEDMTDFRAFPPQFGQP